ncbi:acyl carrier protein [Aquimarina sp. RZ0]|uniref:acyl carrier protein n=1 Tax=Aquimarina sp. RZ0 TaxID=2607730 RepID=UPI0011F32E8F|nr:phosphopantetheine-binding protein [Aquimarina sp. RZ0]KAA1243617.1 acyl carrier protein [Aquimarina sp. RZ0]
MKRKEVLKTFKEILKEHVSEDEMQLFENFNENLSLSDDLAIDSLDVINIVIDIENEFDIEISDEEVKQLTDVASCLDLIEKSKQMLVEE